MTAGRAAARNQKLARGLGVLVVYAVLGPAMGGLAFFSVLASIWLLSTGGQSSPDIWSLLPFALAAGFAFGSVQAIITGAYLGFQTIRRGGFSWLATVLAAVAASLLYAAVLYSPISPIGDDMDKRMGAAAITLWLTPIAVACAVLCRLVCTKLKLVDRGGEVLAPNAVGLLD